MDKMTKSIYLNNYSTLVDEAHLADWKGLKKEFL